MTFSRNILFSNRHQVSSVSIGAIDSISPNFSLLATRWPQFGLMVLAGFWGEGASMQPTSI